MFDEHKLNQILNSVSGIEVTQKQVLQRVEAQAQAFQKLGVVQGQALPKLQVAHEQVLQRIEAQAQAFQKLEVVQEQVFQRLELAHEHVLEKLDTIEKRLLNVETKLSKVEKCVSWENADWQPKRTKK